MQSWAGAAATADALIKIVSSDRNRRVWMMLLTYTEKRGKKVSIRFTEATRAKKKVREFAVFRSPASRKRPQSRGVSIANHRGRHGANL